jgi:hypothetical protein
MNLHTLLDKPKILFLVIMFVMFIVPMFAVTASGVPSDYVTTDNQKNRMFADKDSIDVIMTDNPASYEFMVSVLVVKPNGVGSIYKDIVYHDPRYGNAISHQMIWSFRRYPPKTQDDFLTPLPLMWHGAHRIWYSANGQDPWYKAEFDYVIRRAKELNIKY